MPAIHFPKPSSIRPCAVTPNWAHPLLNACELFVVSGASVMGAKDQRYGVFPEMTGTVDVSLTPFKSLGLTALYNAQGDDLEYPGKPTSSTRNMTLVWMGRIRGLPADTGAFVTSSDTDAGYILGLSTAGVFQVVVSGAGGRSSGLTLSLDVPYLLAASRLESSAGAIDFLVRRLDTGTVSLASTTGAYTPVAGSGTYTIGDWINSGGVRINADTALALITNRWYPAQTLEVLTRDLHGLFVQQSGPLRFWQPDAIVSEKIPYQPHYQMAPVVAQ